MSLVASNTLDKEEVASALLLGIQNRWWPVLPSRFVRAGEKPVGIVRLGEPLMLWRDALGSVHAQIDRCPHRAVPLSRGVNQGDRVRCNYHGVEVGPDGTILSVPGQPGCALEGRKAVRTFPSHEVGGAIFVWFGDRLHREPNPFVAPPELVDIERSNFLCYTDWSVHWRYLYDNNMDPMHGTFLHANSHTMSQGDTEARFVVRETETGFIFEKTGQRDVNFDWSELVDNTSLYVRLEIPYPKSAGPGGNFGIVSYGTPIDADRTACFFWRVRRGTGWQADVWRFLYKNRIERRHWAVLEQDRDMLDGCKAGLERHEMLYQHDVGVVRMRRFLAELTRKQLLALKETH